MYIVNLTYEPQLVFFDRCIEFLIDLYSSFLPGLDEAIKKLSALNREIEELYAETELTPQTVYLRNAVATVRIFVCYYYLFVFFLWLGIMYTWYLYMYTDCLYVLLWISRIIVIITVIINNNL